MLSGVTIVGTQKISLDQLINFLTVKNDDMAKHFTMNTQTTGQLRIAWLFQDVLFVYESFIFDLN